MARDLNWSTVVHPLLARALALSAALALPQTARAQSPVTPTLAAQLRATGDIALDGEGPPALVELRRLRPGLRFNALDGRFTGAFVLNTTPSSLELIDAWAEYRLGSWARVRAGQTKQPFTAYRLGSFTDLAFVDWALVTRAFGGERQLGVELHDRGEDHALEYSIGVWNGSTVRAAHGRGVADVYAEPLDNLSDLRAYHSPDAPHPELTARAAWRRRGPVGLRAGLSALVDAQPNAARDFRAAFAPELALAYGALRVEATGYLGLSERTESPGVAGTWGVLAEARYTVASRVTLGLRFARVDRDAALRADARARADRLIAEAPMDNRPALARRYAEAGAVRAEQELTAAVALRFPSSPVSAQADAGWLRTERGEGTRDAVRLRAQVQLVF